MFHHHFSKINVLIDQILEEYINIAVVGLSNAKMKPSFQVAQYLQRVGYKIYPINPKYSEILGEKCYPSLHAVKDAIEIVDIFRKSEFVTPIVREAIDIGAKVIWMQLGIVNREASKLALKAGLQVIMDRCIKIEHKNLNL
jgi:predicted CoA-binding protein